MEEKDKIKLKKLVDANTQANGWIDAYKVKQLIDSYNG